MDYSVLKIYRDIQNIVATQLNKAISDLDLDPDDFILCDEQAYAYALENKVYKYEKVYLVLSMSAGTVLVNQGVVQPFTLSVYCEDTKNSLCKALLAYFAQTFTFVAPLFSDDYIEENGASTALINQAYSMPVEYEKLVEYGNRRGTHIQIEGTITYGENVFGFQKIEVQTGTHLDENDHTTLIPDRAEIQATTYTFTYTMTPNSANLGNKNDFASSEARFGNITLSLTAIPNSNIAFFRDAIFNIPLYRTNYHISKEYKFKFTVNGNPDTLTTVDANGNAYVIMNFKIVSCELRKETGSIPIVSIGLAEGS